MIRMGYGAAEHLHALVARVARALEGARGGDRRARSSARRECSGSRATRIALSRSTLATLARARRRRTSASSAASSRSAGRRSSFGPITWAIHEPRERRAHGAARRAGRRAPGRRRGRRGPDRARVASPRGRGRLESVALAGRRARRPPATFVFALGPWLGKLVPRRCSASGSSRRARRSSTSARRPGDARFAAPAMPAWIDFGAEIYGIPDLEGKGFKIAPDRHGAPFDPDSGERVADARRSSRPRAAYLAERFPALARRAARRERGLPVREHLERRLPHRPPSGLRERLARRRRLGARLQARPRRRRATSPRASRTAARSTPRFSLATKEAVAQPERLLMRGAALAAPRAAPRSRAAQDPVRRAGAATDVVPGRGERVGRARRRLAHGAAADRTGTGRTVSRPRYPMGVTALCDARAAPVRRRLPRTRRSARRSRRSSTSRSTRPTAPGSS